MPAFFIYEIKIIYDIVKTINGCNVDYVETLKTNLLEYKELYSTHVLLDEIITNILNEIQKNDKQELSVFLQDIKSMEEMLLKGGYKV